MKKIRRPAFLAAVSSLILVSGCLPEEETDAELTEESDLTIALIGEFKNQDTTDPITAEKSTGLHAAKAEFERLHPGVTINFVIMPWSNYVPNTQAMIAGSQADVYQMPGVNDFAAQGLLEPLQPFIEEDDFDLSVYHDNLVEGWMTFGPDDEELEIYSLPVLGDGRFIQYDNELFEQWGVEPLSDYPTVEEVLEKAKQMTGENPVTGEQNYGIYFTGTHDTALTLSNFMEGFGGEWGSGQRWEEIELNFNSTEMNQALEAMIELSEYMPKSFINGQGNERWLTPSNNIAIGVNQGNGNMKTVYAQGLEDRFPVVQSFKNNDGVGSMFSGSPLAIGETSQNKELAWEFIKFSSSEYFQRFLWEEWGSTPVIKEATEWDSIQEMELMIPVLEAMTNAVTPRYPWASSQPRYILQAKAEGALTGTMTVEQALREAQEESTEWIESR
ncbi:ABC-type glycerol-3-phosphate transport system substrate-binding protein [Alkalihalobacillus xiaoxiensis]|uniref:ABC-type glycerol-3-phosphate transport system substrate-binding protein n=1 Tax=Shouchella xiaoxiensis TaxID=766895 RepID=A0ABS2SPT0_9BACI|nr:extracellular solute-binding protein [Shouchella xiaoxiensis]MBM7837166.1 ABC-type glycerol-3-phosphate transport system substrate-binding protein [Shouchella xiaoxiensis]